MNTFSWAFSRRCLILGLLLFHVVDYVIIADAEKFPFLYRPSIAEPSIREIVDTLLSRSPSVLFRNTNDPRRDRKGLRIPILSFISDGMYHIDFNPPIRGNFGEEEHGIDAIQLSFNDVFFIQEDHMSMQYICYFTSLLMGHSLRSRFCACSDGLLTALDDITATGSYFSDTRQEKDLSGKTTEERSVGGVRNDGNGGSGGGNSAQREPQTRIDEIITEAHFANGCLTRPCTNRHYISGSCEIPVDPLQPSALLIYLPAHHELHSDVFGQYLHQMHRFLRYNTTIPMLSNVNPRGRRAERLAVNLDESELGESVSYDRMPESDFHRTQRAIFEAATKILNGKIQTKMVSPLSFVPYYLCNAVVGAYVSVYYRELIEHDAVRMFVIALYGLLLALVCLAYLFYRSSQRVMGRFVPFADLFHLPVFISVVSLMFPSVMVPAFVIERTLDFWDNGFLGHAWVGKAYFLGSICASFAITRWFSLFEPDSMSRTLLEYSVKLLGLVLLSQGSSSREACVLLVVLGFFAGYIQHALWLIYLWGSAIGATPTFKYIAANKMGVAECDKLVSDATQTALADLRAYLRDRNNIGVVHRVADRLRESGKREEAGLLGRFVEGTYPGVPYTVTADAVAAPNCDDRRGTSRGDGIRRKGREYS